MVDRALGEGCGGGVAGTLGVPSHPKSLGRVCGALCGLNRSFLLGPIVATGAVEAERWEEERRGSEQGLVDRIWGLRAAVTPEDSPC